MVTMTDNKKTYEQIAGWIIIRLLLGALLYCFLHYGFWIIHRDSTSIFTEEFSEALAEHAHLYIGRSMINNGCVPKIFLEGDL